MKQRRNFIRKLGGLAALAAFPFPGRTRDPLVHSETSKDSESTFLHVVFFWLVDEAPETKKKFLFELRSFIDHVDLIRSKHVGSPAATNRDVIDNSWSYSLILGFDSKEDQDLYQEHPLHLKFIENASSLWEKVLVYDSIKTN